jgi:hypothetical protein
MSVNTNKAGLGTRDSGLEMHSTKSFAAASLSSLNEYAFASISELRAFSHESRVPSPALSVRGVF